MGFGESSKFAVSHTPWPSCQRLAQPLLRASLKATSAGFSLALGLFIGVLQSTWQAQAQVCCSLKSLEASFEECEKMLAGGKSCSWELKIVECLYCGMCSLCAFHFLLRKISQPTLSRSIL